MSVSLITADMKKVSRIGYQRGSKYRKGELLCLIQSDVLTVTFLI